VAVAAMLVLIQLVVWNIWRKSVNPLPAVFTFKIQCSSWRRSVCLNFKNFLLAFLVRIGGYGDWRPPAIFNFWKLKLFVCCALLPLFMRERSLYLMRSLILSQCRDLRMDEPLYTVYARQSGIFLRGGAIYLRHGKIGVQSVTVVKLGV